MLGQLLGECFPASPVLGELTCGESVLAEALCVDDQQFLAPGVVKDPDHALPHEVGADPVAAISDEGKGAAKVRLRIDFHLVEIPGSAIGPEGTAPQAHHVG